MSVRYVSRPGCDKEVIIEAFVGRSFRVGADSFLWSNWTGLLAG